jgi:hypothetical protein
VEEVSLDHGAVLELASETGLTATTRATFGSPQFKAELVTLDRQLAHAEATTRL